MLILIAYDISDVKRRNRLADLLERYGRRVQLSVFECDLNPLQVQELLPLMKSIIKSRADRVQIYYLCLACQQRFEMYGQGSLTHHEEVYVY